MNLRLSGDQKMADKKFVVNVESGTSEALDLSGVEQTERDAFVKNYEDTKIDRAWAGIRKQRNRLLFGTDWMASSDREISDAEKLYRQKLRDLPSQITDPTQEVDWPEAPK
jgi:hypothetical protein